MPPLTDCKAVIITTPTYEGGTVFPKRLASKEGGWPLPPPSCSRGVVRMLALALWLQSTLVGF
ncbi:MAG: hypothetical protein JW388_1415 [Nitrospira sp.]|nr:hypothetical protein [Nitrospira sp.]